MKPIKNLKLSVLNFFCLALVLLQQAISKSKPLFKLSEKISYAEGFFVSLFYALSVKKFQRALKKKKRSA